VQDNLTKFAGDYDFLSFTSNLTTQQLQLVLTRRLLYETTTENDFHLDSYCISRTFPSGIWNLRGKFTQWWKSENVMAKKSINNSAAMKHFSPRIIVLAYDTTEVCNQERYFTWTFRTNEVISCCTVIMLYQAVL